MRVLNFLKSFALPIFVLSISACGSRHARVEAASPEHQPKPVPVTIVAAGEFRISGPYRHKNLETWLIHGEDRAKLPRKIMTLEEALDQKKVVVHETGEVQELSIENLSDDIDVFLQAGDIVKGGQQDRVIAKDLIVPPKSGKMSLASFCVEQGRWTQRGKEAVTLFGSSDNSVSSIDLKRAVKLAESQSDVWKGVSRYQSYLGRSSLFNISFALSSVSASSLQLTLENVELNKAKQEYAEALSKLVADKKDVIGYAFAINGEINSADVYGSKALFQAMWKKLLDASTLEAVSQFKKDHVSNPVPIEHVRSFLAQTYAEQKTETTISTRIQLLQCANVDNYFFETRDKELVDKNGKVAWLHRNYLRRSGADKGK